MKLDLFRKPDHIHITEFDYHLPDERIAKYPVEIRDNSKLLIYKQGNISASTFSALSHLLNSGDLLVFNNTRVIPARLKFKKETGANIEIFCLEPIEPAEYQQAFQSRECTWKCIVGNLKKWKDASLNKKLLVNEREVLLVATKVEDHKTHQLIRFSWDDAALSFSEIIALAGVTPIPPYLNRETEEIDSERYQTVYSRIQGSVAAPTAGLHFTGPLLDKLQKNGTTLEEITLHVGAGTFKPVQTEKVTDHEMHSEFFQVSLSTLNKLKNKHGNIVSVGTTTLRTLESLYWLGVKIEHGLFKNQNILYLEQWDAYKLNTNLSYPQALQVIIEYLQANHLEELFAYTQIMIAPGYKIKSIKALITNFHQPKSTLLLLVSAITGKDWRKIYDYALENDFRFLSYGDSSILYV